MSCDSNEVVTNVKEPRCHQREKHIERKDGLIQEIIRLKDVTICKIAFFENPLNPAIKNLPTILKAWVHLSLIYFRTSERFY